MNIFGKLALLTLAALPLTLLVPPPGPSEAQQFTGQAIYGGTSTGSANAQVIAVSHIASRKAGLLLRFMPGYTNTGPMTINDGLGAVSVTRPSSIGNVALSGAEVLAGEMTSIVWTGSAYQLASNVDLTPIGRTVEYRGSTTPRGTLVEDGSCVSRTTYAPLFTVVGTTYGACDGSTTFGLPDSRGTMFAALDNQGANGSANRITSGGSGCTATSPVLCGAQNHTISSGEMPSHTHGPGSLTVSIPSTAPRDGWGNQAGTQPGPGVSITQGRIVVGSGQVELAENLESLRAANNDTSLGGYGNATLNGGVSASTGSGSAMSILNPVLIGRRAIKF